MDSAKAKTGLPRELAINGDTYTLVPVKIPVQVNYDPIPGVPETITKESTFIFLQSPRFWALVIGAVSYYLQQKGLFGSEEMTLVATITGLFITIRTLDRSAEMLGRAK